MGGLAEALQGRRVIICTGPGGVGKTSCAAALALHSARQGARVLVLTIDPAKRLADALGLRSLDHQPQKIEADGLRGELWALMLDVRQTFDELIQRHAPNPAQARRILRNGFYQYLTDSLPGAQEFMAVEKLHALVEGDRFDLIVVDTPPAANALDFLDAPQRILDVVDSRTLRFLFQPYKAGGRSGFGLFSRGGSLISKTVARFVGSEMLASISEFIGEFQGLYDGFRERSQRVQELLLGPESGFLLVVSPASLRFGEAGAFRDALSARGFPLLGVIANRVRRDYPLPDPDLEPAQWLRRHQPELSPAEGRALLLAARRLAALAAADREDLRRGFAAELPSAQAEQRPEDIHDLPGLAWLEARLFGGGSRVE